MTWTKWLRHPVAIAAYAITLVISGYRGDNFKGEWPKNTAEKPPLWETIVTYNKQIDALKLKVDDARETNPYTCDTNNYCGQIQNLQQEREIVLESKDYINQKAAYDTEIKKWEAKIDIYHEEKKSHEIKYLALASISSAATTLSLIGLLLTGMPRTRRKEEVEAEIQDLENNIKNRD